MTEVDKHNACSAALAWANASDKLHRAVKALEAASREERRQRPLTGALLLELSKYVGEDVGEVAVQLDGSVVLVERIGTDPGIYARHIPLI